MAMATIGVLVIFFVVFDYWDEVTRGATGLFGVPQATTVYAALGFAVVDDRDRAPLPRVELGPEAAREP